MAGKSATRDPSISVPSVVGFGLALTITLAAAIAVGLLAVVLVG